MNLQGPQPFLKVPWDYKEVASVSFLVLTPAPLRSGFVLFPETDTICIPSRRSDKHMHIRIAGFAVMADVILDSGRLDIAHLS